MEKTWIFPYYVKILDMESGRHYLAAIKPKNQGFSGGASGKELVET